MQVEVEIRQVSTNERRIVDDALPWDGVSLMVWSEGNYSCDCNRELLFLDDDAPDRTDGCGTGRYFVTIRNTETREIIFTDDPETQRESK